MGAGASAISSGTERALQGLDASNAELTSLANPMLPAAEIAPAVKASAVRLQMALSTENGWKELQSVFRSLSATLDCAISSEEWGSIINQDPALRVKYFGEVSPGDIAQQFDCLDEE